jgi:predicted nucleic acid-binding protein
MWKQLDEFEVYISDIVIEEASRGSVEQSNARLFVLKDFQILERNNEILELTKALLLKKAIPQKYPEDAAHIAIASFYNMDYIVTWNFKHINNPFMKRKIRKIVEESGYVCPVLCSPEELIGEEEYV